MGISQLLETAPCNKMKFLTATLIVCGLVLASEARKGGGGMKKLLRKLKENVDGCLADNPLDPAFACANADEGQESTERYLLLSSAHPLQERFELHESFLV